MTQDATTASGAAGALLRRRRAGGLPVRLVASLEDDLAGLHTISVHTHAPYGVVWLELEPHGGGDPEPALRAGMAAVAAVCRAQDGVHRTSPCELVLLVPGADLPATAGLAERAVAAVRAEPGLGQDAVTVRTGVAAFRPGTGQTAPEVAADARRRVRAAEPQPSA